MDDNAVSDVAPWKRVRYLIFFLLSSGFIACYTTRNALAIGIVAMTDNSTNPDFETFDWSLSTQGTVLSSFFWGFLLSIVTGSMLVQRYGTRWVLFSMLLLNGITTLLTPVATTYGGWPATCALRILQGVIQGPYYAASHSTIAKWAPPLERSRLAVISTSGTVIGVTISMAVGGILANSGWGWPSLFYLFGGVSILWCFIWLMPGYSSPASHPYITEKEKMFIMSHYITEETSTFYVPWKDLLTSLPMWAIIIANMSHLWGYHTMVTEMPTYINLVLKYNIAVNGLLNAAPNLGKVICSQLFAWCLDLLNTRGILKGKHRRIFNTIGMAFPIITLISIIYLSKHDDEIAIALLIIGVSGSSAVMVGYDINHLELSPNFAPLMSGISNGMATISSIAVPLVVGAIVVDKTSANEWDIVFWTAAGVYAFGAIFYLTFASEKLQPWNNKTSPDKIGRIERIND